MNQQRFSTLLFYSLFAIGSGILLVLASQIQQLLQTEPFSTSSIESYFQLQKQISYANIAVFIVMLLVSFYILFKSHNKNPLALSNILYIGITLFVFMSSNRKFFELHNGVANQNGSYWLYLFIGIFYILGSLLVSAIGYITIKNYTKRNTNAPEKNRKTKNYH